MVTDSHYMTRALELAAFGGRAVMPNPLVGAVVVHRGKIIGEGWHERYGGPHAEVNAIKNVADQTLLKDSSIYVTLEPCSHFGKTPPCADLIINSGIRHVVIGCLDPNPKVAGQGIAKLRAAGITVTERVLERECVTLNKRFMVFHRLRRPFIVLKWAETTDRFIAREDGTSKWISGEFSRRTTHRWRSQEMAILVGTRTALLDNPSLTVRHVEGENPLRVVIDRKLSLPSSLNLFDQSAKTIVINERETSVSDGIERIQLPFDESLPQRICDTLFERQILSLLIEGGTDTIQRFVDAGLWDEARVFQSKKRFERGTPAPTLGVAGITAMPSGRDRIEIFQHPLLSERMGITA